MLEINPVLSGKFDSPDYAPAQVNFNQGAAAVGNASSTTVADASGTSGVDSRRYTKFDRSASDAGSTTDFSFSDLLDLVNPLEHIPVLSSVYRAVTGDTINPVSRVAGDILYGGAFGVASAILGGAGAAADSIVESETGKDTVGQAIASIFGDPSSDTAKDAPQIAAAGQNGSNPAPATQSTISQAPISLQSANTQIANAAPASTPASIVLPGSKNSDAPTNPGAVQMAGKMFPLDRSKLPYGGVMAPPVGDMQQQNMVMALSQASHTMRLGNTIYTSRLMNGPHPLPVSSTPPAPQTVAGTSTPTLTPVTLSNPVLVQTAKDLSTTASSATPPMSMPADAPAVSASAAANSPSAGSDATGTQKNQLPQALVDDVLMLRALGQYKSVAGGSSSPGAKVDVTN